MQVSEVSEEKLSRHNLPQHFKPGQSGNPNGRPKGSLSRAGELAKLLVARKAGRLVNAIITAAENGDMVAAKMLFDRIWPVAKAETNVTFNQLNLPGMSDIELARRMALMMRALLEQPTQVIDNTEQSDQQPSDADNA